MNPTTRTAESLDAIGRWIGRVEAVVVLSGVTVIFAAVLWGVLTRYVSHRPAAWTGEVASIAFCWTGFVGAALIYGAAHPQVYDPATIGNAVLRRLFGVVSLIVQVAVLSATLILAVKQIGINMANPTAVLRLPGAIFYVPVAWFALSSLGRLLRKR